MSTVGGRLAALVAVLSLVVVGCGGSGPAVTSSRRAEATRAPSRAG